MQLCLFSYNLLRLLKKSVGKWCQICQMLFKLVMRKSTLAAFVRKCMSGVSGIHYSNVIMAKTASQITDVSIVSSTVYSGTDQRKYQSSAQLAFIREIKRWLVNKLVSQMRALLAACREPAGNQYRPPKVPHVFEHKTKYVLIHAPYTRIVVLWHIRNIPQKFHRGKFVIIRPCFTQQEYSWNITLQQAVGCSDW